MNQKNTYPQWVTENLKVAARDYFYLIDRRFPERGVLKLVGDRYRLSGDERTVLYRGIASSARAVVRKNLLTKKIDGKNLVIDGYNVLFSLLNFRMGKIMFIGTDGILRDAGALHGKLKDEKIFKECVDLMIKYLLILKPALTGIYLDSPVSHSAGHSEYINETMKSVRISGECYVIRSADWALKHSTDCVIATSDTAIIEKAGLPVADLPRLILEHNYNAEFVELSDLLAPNQIEDAVDKS
jgi:hypothetical protein